MLKALLVSCLAASPLSCVPFGEANAAATAKGSCPRADDTIETVGFTVADAPFGPASNGETLSVTLSYRYQPVLPAAQLPDVRAVARVATDYLASYSSPTDFLEQVNRGLNQRVLAATPQLVELTTTLTRLDALDGHAPVTSVLTTAPSPCAPSGVTR